VGNIDRFGLFAIRGFCTPSTIFLSISACSSAYFALGDFDGLSPTVAGPTLHLAGFFTSLMAFKEQILLQSPVPFRLAIITEFLLLVLPKATPKSRKRPKRGPKTKVPITPKTVFKHICVYQNV
jgi:hypothetical protein